MKNIVFGTIVLFILLSCQKPVKYQDAINACVPDTMQREGSKEYFLMLSRNCVLGAQLPEFTDTTMDGKIINNDFLKDEVTVINFWFIGCHPCEDEMPGLNRVVEKFKSKNVKFLAISRNSPADITEFLATHPFSFDQIAYGEPVTQGIFQMKWGYPTTLVADKHHKIIYVSGGVRENGKEAIEGALTPVIEKAL